MCKAHKTGHYTSNAQIARGMLVQNNTLSVKPFCWDRLFTFTATDRDRNSENTVLPHTLWVACTLDQVSFCEFFVCTKTRLFRMKSSQPIFSNTGLPDICGLCFILCAGTLLFELIFVLLRSLAKLQLGNSSSFSFTPFQKSLSNSSYVPCYAKYLPKINN